MRMTPEPIETHRIRTALGSALVLGALALSAAPASLPAQEIDARWLPWLGCWQPVSGALEAGQVPGSVTGEDADRELVCAHPADDGVSLELVTVADAEITGVERVRPGGEEVRIRREGCEEARTARFSDDGTRVFTRVHHLCEGGLERTTSGVMAFVSPDEWIEVSVVEVEGEGLPWVRRYRAASPRAAAEAGFEAIPSGRATAVRMARRAAASGPTVDEVIGASGHAHPDAVRTWIAERGERLRVDSDALVRMDEAGVPPEVIDVVVAVSFPERFALDRQGSGAGYDRRGTRRARGLDPYGHRYGHGLPPWYYDYYFTPFGRRHGFGSFGGFGPTRVIVVDRNHIDSGGRVVNGRGYTRGSSGSSGSSASGTRTPSRSGSSGSAAPSSSSSDRSDSGRRAKPRGGGDGGDGS